MIAYTLNKNLDGEKILKDIQKLISSSKESTENLVLVISLNRISQDNNDLIPKLEFKP